MNITFITKKFEGISTEREKEFIKKGIKIEYSLLAVKEFLESGIAKHKIILDQSLYNGLSLFPVGVDTEFSSLNFHLAKFYLLSIGNYQKQFVIDMRHYSPKFLEAYNDDILWIAHNAQVEESITRVNGFKGFTYIWDTLIVEQRLRMGLGIEGDKKNKNDKKVKQNTLDKVIKRRLGVYYELEKDEIRKSFTKTITEFTYDQVLYSAKDIEYLVEIAKSQFLGIKKWKQEELIYNIEFPLIQTLSNINITGIHLDKDKWKVILANNKTKLFKLNKQLDDELKKLSITYPEYDVYNKNLNPAKSKRAKSLKRTRNSYESVQTDLFGNDVYTLSDNDGNINYSSSSQVINLFVIFEEPIPYKEERNMFGETTRKNTTGTPELGLYLEEHPNTKLRDFIKVLIEYKETEKEINSFGERFLVSVYKQVGKKTKIGYLNHVTNKIHTIYRQCTTTTGRFSSGNAIFGYFNSQQIPRDNNIRQCFGLTQKEIDEGYYITTLDLVGAEVVIMCALAQDEELYNYGIINDDLHSPIATAGWRAIYQHRVEKKKSLKISDMSKNKYTLTPDFVVDKKTNTGLRQDFKNFSFGAFYGMAATKGAKTLGISVVESEIVINTMKKMFPKTFAFLDSKSKEAVTKGRIKHNTRTNSIRWFPKILEAIQEKKEPSFSDYIGAYNEARNAPIQGTQADMIKESIVELIKWKKKNNLDLELLFQVHDELVIKHKNKDLGKDIAEIVSKTCTKYLNGFVEMKVDYKTLTTWMK